MSKRIISFKEDNEHKLSTHFENFLIFKQAQGICQRTKKDYEYYFNKLLQVSNDDINLSNLKLALLKLFSTLNNKSSVTYNMPYKYLNSFFNWCVLNKILDSNPIKDLGLKKKKETPRAIDIPHSIINQLLNSFNLKTYSGFRNYVIFIVSIDTGIRPNEILNIKRSDINFKTSELIVRENISKTRKQRLLPLSHITLDLLHKLIQITPRYWNQSNVFYTADGRDISSDCWSKIIRTQCKKLDIKVTAYSLRHFFAIEFLRKNGNIFALQMLMGHTDISTTKKYIALSQVDLKKQHELATPLSSIIQRNTRVIKLFK